jgi:hypothetical protein
MIHRLINILFTYSLRFAAKCVAFCGKTRCIMRQNALHFAAKRTVLCGKMQVCFAAKREAILRQNAGLFSLI